MNNEDLRLIAEGLGFEVVSAEDRVRIKHAGFRLEGMPFNPLENWNDTGLVLEALMKETDPQLLSFSEPDRYMIEGYVGLIGDGDTLQEAICQAYLTLIKGE